MRAEHNAKRFSERLEKQAQLQLETGSTDGYGHGLYNGLLMAASLVSGEEYQPVSFKEYAKVQGILQSKSHGENPSHEPV